MKFECDRATATFFARRQKAKYFFLFCALTVIYDKVLKNPDGSFVVVGNGAFLLHIGILYYLCEIIQVFGRKITAEAECHSRKISGAAAGEAGSHK